MARVRKIELSSIVDRLPDIQPFNPRAGSTYGPDDLFLCALGFEPKPRPRWDVHSPEAGNRAGNLARALRPLTVGPSGSGASPRLSG